MILADKIIEERKKLGLSQEELADKLSVSRQAVSKWESAQTIPDLQKIILMSELFSVSTDYILKDEIEREKIAPSELKSESVLRRVTMGEANEFMSIMKRQSKSIALGVLLCILSPVLLILLAGFSDMGIGGITERVAAIVGLLSLFILVATAVYIFIRHASRVEKFNYLNVEEFETEYGVSGIVKEKKEGYEPIFNRYLTLGIILCVLSPLPLIITAIAFESEFITVIMVALLLCIVSVGVYMIIRVAMVKSCYQMLLQEGEYSEPEKIKNKSVDATSGIYWSLAVAVYLTWSFITKEWDKTWIVWAIAGVLFVPFTIIVKSISSKK